jgi:uncharacterized protein
MDAPFLGFGVGLRAEHYPEILSFPPRVDWFEALTENYLDCGGRPLTVLERVRRDFPVGLHGVAMSIGSTDPLDFAYLNRLKALIERIEPALVTDHLCWTGVEGRSPYDLLPLPATEEALAHVVERVRVVQDFLDRQIALENPSAYFAFAPAAMSEGEFLAAVAEEADCAILLDVNNVHVSAANLGFDPFRYVDVLPARRVVQLHLAGIHGLRVIFLRHPRRAGLGGGLGSLRVCDAAARDALDAGRVGRRSTAVVTARRGGGACRADCASGPAQPAENGLTAFRHSRAPSGERTLPRLRDLQRRVAAVVLDPAGAQGHFECLRPWLASPPRGTASERLSVHVEGYPVRLREALEEAFPAVRRVAGRRAFAEIVERYRRTAMLRSYNLNDAGPSSPDSCETTRYPPSFRFSPTWPSSSGRCCGPFTRRSWRRSTCAGSSPWTMRSRRR